MNTPADAVHQQAVRLAQERRLGDKLNPDRLASMIANKTPGEAAAILLAVGYVLGYSDGQSADKDPRPARTTDPSPLWDETRALIAEAQQAMRRVRERRERRG